MIQIQSGSGHPWEESKHEKRIAMNRNDYFKNRIKKSNRGSTMIEVLVAFTVLSLIMGFSSELRMRSVDAGNVLQDFNREIYNTTTPTGADAVVIKKEYTTSDRKTLFYLKDRESGTNIPLTDVDAVSYTYNVPGEESERMQHVVIPKAVTFIHKADKPAGN